VQQTIQLADDLNLDQRGLLGASFELGHELVDKVSDLDHLVLKSNTTSLEDQRQVRLDRLEAKSLKDSSQVSCLDRVVVGVVVDLHRLVEGLTGLLEALSDLGIDLLLNELVQRVAPLSYVGVHLGDEFIVRDSAVGASCDQTHQVVDLVVGDSDFKRCEALSHLLLRQHTVAIDVEKLEGLLKVKVLDVECRCDLVQSSVEPNHPQVVGFELSAESRQVNFTDALRVCDPPQDSLVLHSKRQVQLVDEVFELLDRDYVLLL